MTRLSRIYTALLDCLLHNTRPHFFLYSTKKTRLDLNGCVCFRKPLCYLCMIVTKDVSNACMREIASFFSTSSNTHVCGYAGEKTRSFISMSTELVRAEYAYKVRCCRVPFTTPILTSLVCLPKLGGIQMMAVPVFQNTISKSTLSALEKYLRHGHERACPLVSILQGFHLRKHI